MTDAPQACPLHGDALLPDEVPLQYGLPALPPGFLDAWRDEFPHANSIQFGGCVVGDDDPSTAAVRYCPTCRRREAAWHR